MTEVLLQILCRTQERKNFENRSTYAEVMHEAVWLNGNGVGHVNVVALRWARLVLGWVMDDCVGFVVYVVFGYYIKTPGI